MTPVTCVRDVLSRLEEIRQFADAHKPLQAFNLERSLWEDTLRAIATKDHTSQAFLLAQLALRSQTIKFPR
jgi:hypothetical protein